MHEAFKTFSKYHNVEKILFLHQSREKVSHTFQKGRKQCLGPLLMLILINNLSKNVKLCKCCLAIKCLPLEFLEEFGASYFRTALLAANMFRTFPNLNIVVGPILQYNKLKLKKITTATLRM